MAEKEAGKLSGLKAAWKNPKSRKGMLMFGGIGAVVLIISASMMGRREAQVAPPGSAALSAPAVVQDGENMPQGDRYKQMNDQYEKQRFEKASQSPGEMVVPAIPGLTDPNQKPETKLPETAPVQAEVQTQPPVAPISNAQSAASAEEYARTHPAYAAISKLLAATLGNSMSPDQNWAPITPPQAAAGSTATAQNTPPSSAAASAAATQAVAASATKDQAQAQSDPPLIRLGTTLFGTLDTAINTDYSGPVVATIRQGRFSGAKLTGTKTLEQDAVVFKFNLMAIDGIESALPVTAYAVGIENAKKFGLTGIPGSTDYHVVQRYILPAAVAFIRGYGEAASRPDQSMAVTTNGVVQNTSALTKQQMLYTAAGQAMQPLFNDIQNVGSRPITVSLDSGKEIGIMFAADVTKAGAIGAPNQQVPTGSRYTGPDQLSEQALNERLAQQLQQIEMQRRQSLSAQQGQMNQQYPAPGLQPYIIPSGTQTYQNKLNPYQQ